MPPRRESSLIAVYHEPPDELMQDLLRRPKQNHSRVIKQVRHILGEVKKRGDQALIEFSRRFDKVDIPDFKVSREELENAGLKITGELKAAIDLAVNNIRVFHGFYQPGSRRRITTMPGIACWQETRAIEKVGLYVPGGSAPLFSTVLMLGVPAGLAGCRDIIICTPPRADGGVHPLILYCANLLGISKVYRLGGAQAVAAMAYGTESIPKVYKIFGPGNQFVTQAKMLLAAEGCAIDMPAGPSELAIIGDETANPAYVAADILSQAEHGKDSQVLFFPLSENLISPVCGELVRQLVALPRKKIIQQCLDHCRVIYLSSPEKALDYVNLYAPEHLVLAVREPKKWVKRVQNAGSIFLGNYSAQTIGDYASGTNHTLPTAGYAKSVSGVSVTSFLKTVTCQAVSRQGLLKAGPAVEILAEEEQLTAHKMAVRIRRMDIAEEGSPDKEA